MLVNLHSHCNRYGGVWAPTMGLPQDENSEVVTVTPHHLIRFKGTSNNNHFFNSVEFGLSDGRTAGYYGYREASHITSLVHRPQCKIAYFSGFHGNRIDQVYVHWEC